ncbi:MAG: hypothetical protein DRQ55_12370 [Planctomycetota bacterium]|nr:MAG: hypothetical protein DRQ55_12370 [Planctomycetota bacterium]
MDSDYSVFSILPPFNVVWAQLIDPAGHLIDSESGFTLTYEALSDPSGSINASSAGKTSYWNWAPALFGASSEPDTGLFGFDMPGPDNTPQAMAFDPEYNAWVATGIPLVPTDDDGHVRTYPLMKIVARNGSGVELASSSPVLPVSSEMDCRACHASGSQADAMPAAGWVYERKAERDYRLNILRLHDEQKLGTPTYDAALAALAFNPAGLYASVKQDQRPVLCASCHLSNALPGTGLPDISSLTSAVHAFHADVIDPTNGMTLQSADNRSACYRCHPGSETRCLRGAMGAAVASDGELSMQCQNCHAGMSAVGDPRRVGWLEQPTCQACHTGTAMQNNGQIRYLDAFEPDGSLRLAVNDTFATDVDAPAAGFSLYRFSEGHGGLQCSACHGSTHAEYPAAHPNDNIAPSNIQGHSGMLVECDACHVGQPVTITGGPHGMHPVGDQWVKDHEQLGDEHMGQCRACHGADYRGTVLSRAQAERNFFTDDFGTKSFFDGEQISCYACHNGPASSNPSTNAKPTAQGGSISVAAQPVAHTLLASDPNGSALSYRIVTQPAHGRVGLSGNVATYIPDPGFAGLDSFSWSAWDGKADSNLARVRVTRLAGWSSFGGGYPGTGGATPQMTSSAAPALGSSISIGIGNTSGVPTTGMIVASTEYALIDTSFGGTLLTEPTILIPLVIAAAGELLPVAIPNDVVLLGTTTHVQTALADPGAPFGFAFTPALRLTIGL